MLNEIGTVTASDGSVLLHMWQVYVPSGERALRKHSHLCIEITIVNSGGGVYTVGDKLYPMEPGDVFIFGSNEQHCITNVNSVPADSNAQSGQFGLSITNLHFEPRYLWGNAADSLSEENSNISFARTDGSENRISADRAAPLAALFMEIEKELSAQEAEYCLSVKSLLNLLLIRLIREYGYTGKDAFLHRQKLHSLRRVITYIDLNPAAPMTLKSLSAMAGMSPNYFSALFHKISGITLWEYISARRIDKALRLLSEESPKNLIDIAELCGYNNTANFNKAFKKLTGMTPREYRSLEKTGDSEVIS
ncbi:MAG: helix-turn-helix domain-containing protein [Eubacteriales bacterium]